METRSATVATNVFRNDCEHMAPEEKTTAQLVRQSRIPVCAGRGPRPKPCGPAGPVAMDLSLDGGLGESSGADLSMSVSGFRLFLDTWG